MIVLLSLSELVCRVLPERDGSNETPKELLQV